MASKNPNPFLTDIIVETVTGRRKKRVIVLSDNESATVHIPLNGIARVDYNRLRDLHSRSEVDLLTAMRDFQLDNGRNALVVYKNLIQVHNKPVEKKEKEEDPILRGPESSEDSEKSEAKSSEDAPKRRGPGRPPKKKD